MKTKNIVVMTTVLLMFASVASAGIFDVAVLGEGDGYFTNYSGPWDDYNSNGDSVRAHYQFWGDSSDVASSTGYLQFGLGSAPDVADITSVELFGYFNSSYLTGSTLTAGSVGHVSNSISATGNASQRLYGNQLVTTVDPGMSGWNSVDVTDMIVGDLMNGYSWSAFSLNYDSSGDYRNRYAGFSLASAESGNASYLRFYTGTADTNDSNAIPEPATMLLFATGLTGAFIRKRCKG